jgi:hypothetical protein
VDKNAKKSKKDWRCGPNNTAPTSKCKALSSDHSTTKKKVAFWLVGAHVITRGPKELGLVFSQEHCSVSAAAS